MNPIWNEHPNIIQESPKAVLYSLLSDGFSLFNPASFRGSMMTVSKGKSHTLFPFCDVSHHKPLTLLSSLSCTHSPLSTSSHSILNVCAWMHMCDVKMILCLSLGVELWLWCLGVACLYQWTWQHSLHYYSPVFLPSVALKEPVHMLFTAKYNIQIYSMSYT